MLAGAAPAVAASAAALAALVAAAVAAVLDEELLHWEMGAASWTHDQLLPECGCCARRECAGCPQPAAPAVPWHPVPVRRHHLHLAGRTKLASSHKMEMSFHGFKNFAE